MWIHLFIYFIPIKASLYLEAIASVGLHIAFVCLSGPLLDDDICVIELDLRYYSVKFL